MQLKKPKVLVLGSGFVSHAIGDYFSDHSNFDVTFGTIDEISGKKICNINPKRFKFELINAVSEPDKLLNLAKQHDLVMSLIPPPLHKYVAQACIEAKKNLVTSSYISEGINVLYFNLT